MVLSTVTFSTEIGSNEATKPFTVTNDYDKYHIKIKYSDESIIKPSELNQVLSPLSPSEQVTFEMTDFMCFEFF